MTDAPLFLLQNLRRPGRSDQVDLLIAAGRVAQIAPAGSYLDVPAESVNAGGAVLLPGLWDAHVHFRQWALRRERLDLAGAEHPHEVLRLVRAELPLVGPNEPLIGYGFRDATWPEPPTQQAIDAAAGDRRVVLIAWDLHCAWLSSAAARWLGVQPDPDGVVREAEWFATSRQLDERMSDDDAPAIARAARAAAARGVVGIVDLEMADNLATWPTWIAAGADQLRVRAGFYPDQLDAVLAGSLRTGDLVEGGAGLIEVGPLKIISDGSLNTRTAACRHEYRGAGGHGVQEYDTATMVRLISTARRGGLETTVHAIGDAAVTAALDAFEGADSPGRIEHAQLVHPSDVSRFADLDVTVSGQPEHALDDQELVEEYWPECGDWSFRWRTLLEAGARLRFGSDAPVARLDPWVGIGAAVARSRPGRMPWHPEQAITIGDALAASADGRRQVQVGDVADLALVAQDPTAVAPHALEATDVVGTLRGGTWTHRQM